MNNPLLKVMIERGNFVDESREFEGEARKIPYKFYYPEGGASQKPLIIWSHGLGGTRDGAGYIARFLAAHDYCLLHIQHRGTDSSLWEGKPGHPWDNIRKTKITRSITLDRYRDVPFVLDHLKELEHFNIIDTKRIGMSGHSFGALTTQVMCGQLFPDKDENLIDLREDRFVAGMLYSFVAMGHLFSGDPSILFEPMDKPLFFMTGTDDGNPVDEVDYTFRMPVWEHAGAEEKYLLLLEDGDHMVYNGSRGKLGDNPKRELHEKMICEASLLFWDMKLKGNKQAEEKLRSGAFNETLGDEATLTVG